MGTPAPMTAYGFSNIDVGKQIIVAEKSVFAGISRANQTISIYHGETLIADCTMPATGKEDIPTVVTGELTVHDETFTGFVEGETYTIVAGDEPSITGFVMNGVLSSFDASVLWSILHYAGRISALDVSASRTNYAISQKITTTKKRYDIKLLPEELLPKTVATKAEVRTAKSTADAAQSMAETAQNTAEMAQNTANAALDTAEMAQNTAETAKSTAESVAASAVKARDGYLYAFDSSSADNPYPVISLYEKYRAVKAQLDENIGLILNISRDGGVNDPNTSGNPATIKMINNGGSGGVIIDGLRSLIMTSSTPNSTKKFKITVDDSGTLSAVEVTDAS